MSSNIENVSLRDSSQLQMSTSFKTLSVNDDSESHQKTTLDESSKIDSQVVSTDNQANVELYNKYNTKSSEELISMIRGILNKAFKEAQGFNSVVVNYFFNRDNTAYKRLITTTYFQDIISKIAIPLKVLQNRMDDCENSSTGLLTGEEIKTIKEYLKVYDQIMAHIEFLSCMRESFCLEARDDFDSLLKYSDWICCLNEAHVNFTSTQNSELLHKDLQAYLRNVYDSFLSKEIIGFERAITSMFRTLIDWNVTTSDKMSNFSKMELTFNFSGPEIESVLIAAFNTGSIDVIMTEFLEVFSCFVDQCMKFSFIDCYSVTEGPISTVTLTDGKDISSDNGRDVKRKYIMKFAEGFPAEYQIKLKNFISKTPKEDVPGFKLSCLINFLEQFYKDAAEIFKFASCEITDGGRFSLLSYIGDHGLSSKIMERIRVSVNDVMNLTFNNPDEIIKLIEKIDTVMAPYVSSGLISDGNFISSMGAETKDRLTKKMCGEIMGWLKRCCIDEFPTVTTVGVPESAILHNISSYKDDVLWKVDRSNIMTIVNEERDEVLPLKARLVQCQITVAGKRVTDYVIQLMNMHALQDLYNRVTVEKTLNAFLENYVNIIENNYGDRLTQELNLATSFFNSCYYLTKRIGVYLNYSISEDRFCNFVMMQSKLRDLACSSLGYHLMGFKRDLSSRLLKGNVFIENCSEYSLTKNAMLLRFYKELHLVVGSLKSSVTSGIFKIVLSEIMNEILTDMIGTLTKMKPLTDIIHYDNIIRNLNDFLARIDEILSKYCDSTKLVDLSPDAVVGLSQISIIMSGAQYDTDITQVSNKNLIFNNSTIKTDLALLVTSIYPDGNNKAKILEHLR